MQISNAIPLPISQTAPAGADSHTNVDWNSSGNWKDTGAHDITNWNAPVVFSFIVDSQQSGYIFNFNTLDDEILNSE